MMPPTVQHRLDYTLPRSHRHAHTTGWTFVHVIVLSVSLIIGTLAGLALLAALYLIGDK